jgi:hypothetical protein
MSIRDEGPFEFSNGFDDDERDPHGPWCDDLDGHKAAHRFCVDHQASWCRECDGACPDCEHDPHCRYCHCALFEEYHDWDCPYVDDED